MFEDSERVIFSRNPLKEVIWQLRFPRILSISAKSPADFQDRVRHHYPIYEPSSSGVPQELVEALAKAGAQLDTGGTHRFKSEDEMVSVSLTDSFVAVSTKRYTTWPDFRFHIQTAFEALCEAYNPALFTRSGLRYINLINRLDLDLQDKSWNELITSELLGPLVNDDLARSVKNFRATTDVDLGDYGPGVARVQFGLHEPETFRIDSDFYLEAQLHGEEATKSLNNFNRLIGNVFRWAIREPLHRALEPRNPG